MKNAFILLFGIWTLIWTSSEVFGATISLAIKIAPDKKTLTGKITDKHSGIPLAGVNIYLPDLKTGTISESDGSYKINNLPSATVLVQVTLVGYKLIAEKIDLTIISNMDFAMEESVNELNEIVVTGLSKAAEKNRTPTPISTIPPSDLQQHTSTNIIDALASQPGIDQITTGSGISKPVIRGLGYNRVVTINDGIRQEGQQWGDEHGIEIDEFSVYKIEILKGPASLTYGSDAMAGVINMISAPTLPEGKINGNLLANYQSNNGLIAYSANIAGNKKGFIWNLRYSNKRAHAYQNKYDGYVLNSGFKEHTLSGIAGLNKSWGYAHLHWSVYDFTPGIIEGERDSATGLFIKHVAINDSTENVSFASEEDYTAYTPLTPFQKIQHSKIVLNNSFILGNGTLKTIFGWQQNQRKEYDEVLNKNQFGLYFLMNTFNYELRYLFPEMNTLNIAVGINGMKQNSLNKGSEFLVPEYDLFDIGAFAIAKKSIGKLDISGGLRFDSRNEQGKDLYLDQEGNMVTIPDNNSERKFSAFNTSFNGISGSIGFTYQFTEHIFTKFNLSRGFRAPNIGELGANGIHEGTLRYEIGDPKLKAEQSLQFDYALGLNLLHVTADIDLFSNTIDHFIFSHKLQSTFGGDSINQGYSTFKFASGNAHLYGGELTIDIHPHPYDWLHFENSLSYVHATQNNQSDSSKYLPYTPPVKYSSELKASSKTIGKYLANAYVEFGMEHHFRQNQIYSAFNTETETPGYTLLNLGFGADLIVANRTFCSLYININNITDAAYQSHLSRLKYAPVNYASDKSGIYNMGRNVSIKLLVPIGN